jgi:hypothetical protein
VEKQGHGEDEQSEKFGRLQNMSPFLWRQVRQNCLKKPVLQCMLNVYEFLARFKVASVWRKHDAAGDGAAW